MENTKLARSPQPSDKFILRMPDGMRGQIANIAKANNRSMNAEIIARLQGSLDAQSVELSQVASGVLLDEVIARYGAQLQIIMPKEAT